jgi:hypothetical protein
MLFLHMFLNIIPSQSGSNTQEKDNDKKEFYGIAYFL